MKNISLPWRIILNGIFIAYTAMCIIPLVLVLMISVTDEMTLVLNGYSFFPEKMTLEAFVYTISQGGAIARAYGITVLVTAVGAGLSVLFVAMIAYPLSRTYFRHRKFFTFYVVITMLFSGGMVPWYLICVQVLHLKDSLAGLIVPYLMNPFYIIIMRTFFKSSVHESMVESAKIDGAGDFRIFFAIAMRLSLPGLATVGLFQTLAYWNDWYLPMMLIYDNKLINLQYLMYKVQQNISFLTSGIVHQSVSGEIGKNLPSESARMAMAILAIGPIVLAYPFFQKYFVKGLTLGAIKG